MRILATIIVFLVTAVSIQAQRDIDPEIISALTKGDAIGLSSHFNENIELILGSVNDVYSKKQATGIIADFFRKNKVSSLQVIHKGAKENSAFTICTMRAGNSSYRVYVLVRKSSTEQQLIQQLRIETTND